MSSFLNFAKKYKIPKIVLKLALLLCKEADKKYIESILISEYGVGGNSNKLQRLSEEQKKIEDLIRRSDSVAVIGNAKSNDEKGEIIDSYSLVIRFNRYVTDRKIYGEKKDIVVLDPSLYGEYKRTNEKIILSGYAKQYMIKGEGICCIPTKIWRTLITKTHKPPSAGLLMVQYLMTIVPPSKITIFNFTNNSSEHVTGRIECNEAHNWLVEKAIFEQYRQQGVRLG